MDTIIKLDSVDTYNKLFGLETKHPLVSVVDLSKATTWPDSFTINYGVYALYLKDTRCGDIIYGRQPYDYQEGTIVAKNTSYAHSLIPDLNAGNSDGVTANSKNINELARRSYFGRLMYNYKSKYYVQGNIRRDGSSRFAPDCRWGTFLSASAGWVFTEEKFMEGARKVLDHGKLRLSYGELGNERIKGYYPYQAVLANNHTMGYVGSTLTGLSGYAQAAAIVTDITWETTSTFDVGGELSLFRNRLSVTGDWYYKKTRDMLLQVPIAPIMGLSDPYDNIGDMNTKGWEITLGWRDNIGDFSYGLTFNLSDDVSKMGYIGNKEVISNGKIIREGEEYQSWYGYVSEGLYQTPEEVANSATMGSYVSPGDIRYRNFGDGDPNNPLISTDYARRVMGVGQRNSYLTDEMVQPLRGQWYNFATYIGGGNSWSRKNTIEQNKRAKYPRYSWASANNNYAISDYWLFDGSYFRVKNISLGYTLPQKWMSKIHVKSLRFAVTLTDFFTHSHFPEGWDPEVGTTGYPITKSVLFSAQLKF